MPIRTTCPECQAVYDLADHLAGKRVVCAECKSAIEVPDPSKAVTPSPAPAPPRQERRRADEDRPRRRRRRFDTDEDEDRPPRRRSSGTPVGLIVGAVVGLLVLTLCAGGFFVMIALVSSRPKPPPPVAFPAPAPAPFPGPAMPRPNGRADALAELNRGNVLAGQGRDKEAEAAYREAIRLDPTLADAHFNLGGALDRQNRPKEAETAYREAIRLQPDNAVAHCNLAKVLMTQKRYKDAEAPCREAIRLDPNMSAAHYNLGTTLLQQGRNAEAEAPLRTAVRLKPDDASAHNNLGWVLGEQGKWKEAEAAEREAVRLNPNEPLSRYNLGNALYVQGRYGEAEAPLRQAIRLKPDYAVAHCKLGQVLRDQGRFAPALAELRRGDELGRKTPQWGLPSDQWVRACERLIELDRRLPSILAGEAKPAGAAERVEFVSFCVTYKHLPATAARLAAATLADEPNLGENLRDLCTYDGACGAALSAAGQGADSRQLPDKVAAMMRRQAFRWLREDLALYARQAERDAASRRRVGWTLAHWQRDTDLTSVREPGALMQLPPDERKEWRAFWDDVTALRQKTEPAK